MRTKLTLTTISLLAVLCTTAGKAYIVVPGDSLPRLDGPDTVRQIERIVIIGRSAKEIVPAQILSGDQLQRLSSHSVADALRYFSGLQVKDYGGIGGLKTVNVRSMGTEHVGVFYDGIQLGNAQNGQVDLGKFSLDNMELIGLYNGQKSDIFQSARDFASSSSVYMVTRKPHFQKNRDDNFTFKVKSGSFQLINTSALWEHRFGENLSSSANVEFMNTSGKYKYRYQKKDGWRTTEYRRNGDVLFLRGEAALFGRINNGEWQTKAYFYDSTRGYPGGVPKKAEEFLLWNEDRQKDRNFFLQSSFRQKSSEIHSYKLGFKYANDYMNYVMPAESSVKPSNIYFRQQEVYLTAANLISMNRWWTANLSTDFQWNKLNADERADEGFFNENFPAPRRYTLLAAAATSAAFDRIRLQASVLYTYVHDHSAKGAEIATDKNRISPTVILSYTPFKTIDLNFRAFYKEIFRMPTFNDLYYVQIGNRLLKPEYTTQYNIGLVYDRQFAKGALEGVNLTLDTYYNEVKDKIIAIPKQSQMIWTMVNMGYVEMRGVDFTGCVKLRVGKIDLTGRLSYTFQKSQDFTPEHEPDEDFGEFVFGTYGDQIPYIPRHSGSVVINADYGNWAFNYSYIYTGERHVLGNDNTVNNMQPWYTHDMSLSRKIRIKKSLIRITAEVNNIFNQQFEVVEWYPMPGTNFKFILSLAL